MADVDERDEDEFVVLPNRFVDGWSGREVKAGYNGEPRIKCYANGRFQIGPIPFEGLPGPEERPVQANGFSIVLMPTTTHPDGENTHIAREGKGPWPPTWWPSIKPGPNAFSPGVPTVNPHWEIPWGSGGGPPGGGGGPGGDGDGDGIDPGIAPLAGQTAPRQSPRPPPRRK